MSESRGAPETSDGTRRRKLTEKGSAYQLEVKQKSYGKLSKELDSTGQVLLDYVRGDKDSTVVLKNFTDWKHDYVLFVQTAREIKLLLPDEDAGQHDCVYAARLKTFNQIKTTVEKYLQSSPGKAGNEDSSKTTQAKSQSSRRSSSTSSHRSKISLLRVQEEQKQAELASKSAHLKKKQDIEKKRMQLKWEEEQLEMDAAIEASAARARVLKDADALTDIQSVSDEENQVHERGNQERNPMEMEPDRNQEPAQHNCNIMDQREVGLQEGNLIHGLEDLMLSQARVNRLPALEPEVFKGDVSHFPLWLKSFESNIESHTQSAIDRLHYLGRYTSGEAKRAILGFLPLRTEDAYRRAKEKLMERYGNEFIMTNTYRDQIRDWQPIKTGDGKALREFVDFLSHCEAAMCSYPSMQVLDDPHENHNMLKKLPRPVVDRWRRVVDESLHEPRGHHPAAYPPFRVFVRFLEKEARIACGPVQLNTDEKSKEVKFPVKNKKPEIRTRTFVSSADVRDTRSEETKKQNVFGNHDKKCYLCSGDHFIEVCTTFKKMTLAERQDVVKKRGLCRGCLRRGHIWRTCQRKRECGQCGRLHPTVLHDDSLAPRSDSDKEIQETRPKATSLHVSTSDGVSGACSHSMIVPVYIHHEDDVEHRRLVYALLDPQSDACFITDSVAQAINVQGESVVLELNTMTGKSLVKSSVMRNLIVSSIDGSATVDLPATYTRQEVPADRDSIPRKETTERWNHLKDLSEEIPPYFPDAEIGLLIGANCAKAVKPREVKLGKDDDPWAVKSLLGWCIVGLVDGSAETSSYCRYVAAGDGSRRICHFVFRTHVQEVSPLQVARMFELDFQGSDNRDGLSVEDRLFLQKLNEGGHMRDDGHYELPLPLKREVKLPNNKDAALKRLIGLQKRLDKDKRYRDDYLSFMENNLEKGYAEPVPDGDLGQDDGRVWYLPHHGVYHPKKPNKIRVVFDCSHDYQGYVLNKNLLQGPDLSNNMLGILCRFRKNPVAFSCDIESMFNQVHVTAEDRNYLRFLWWKDSNFEVAPTDYRMTTHLFGATSSPGCAMFALRATADANEEEFDQNTADFVRTNFYVDDGLTSLDDADTALRLIQGAVDMCKRGGFKLTKFTSNSAEVMKSLPEELRMKQNVVDPVTENTSTERALGVLWDTASDLLKFEARFSNKPPTRRGILSMVSSLFDPLGLVSPFVLTAKRGLQDLCRDGYSWDEPVPENIAKRWQAWVSQTVHLSQIAVPRCYKSRAMGVLKREELHHFCDASLVGYGEVSYVRLVDEEDVVCCSLVMSKSRVTPTRSITAPGLELTAAVTAVKVSCFLRRELDIENLKEYFWTDSRVVLGYISNESSRFQIFVANRVQFIRDRTTPDQWRHISTELNPADLVSRGTDAQDLISNDLWWSGPPFLSSPQQGWQDQGDESVIHPDDPEVKTQKIRSGSAFVTVTTTRDDENDTTSGRDGNDQSHLSARLSRFSSWDRARRAVANCLRFKRVLQSRTTSDESRRTNLSTGPIGVQDVAHAEGVIITDLQREHFSKDQERTKLNTLDPFLREDGVLCVGGRVRRSSLPREVAHPVILPRSSHVTEIIIGHFHEKTAHSGRGITLGEIRAAGYWIVGGRGAVSRYIFRCVTCRKLRGPTVKQKMADLPSDRMEEVAPFTYSAVDYFGPYYIKERRSEVKRWGVMFTCMSSRAVHLEVANSLTTDSFINAFRRFICRRGPVRQLRCDQGTNFVGGKNAFEHGLTEMDRKKIGKELMKHSCDVVEFKMNVPHASHMGGVWERMIRTARSTLTSLLMAQGTQLDDELLRTLFTETEAIVNSRPLTCSEMSPLDLSPPLSPSMILTLKPQVVLPPPGEFVREDLYCHRRWRRVQHLANVFWERWRKEFLPTLQPRPKWTSTHGNLEENDIVIVLDDNLPRSHWPMGRVLKVYPSADNLVRKAKVMVGASEYDRPVHRLILVLKNEND